MITLFKRAAGDMARLFFPHICAGCGSDLLEQDQLICLQCLGNLPYTSFALHANNPVEKIFWGRIPVKSAMSLFYFTKDSPVQHLLHQLKYAHKKEVGVYLGKLLGDKLINSNRFMSMDAIIPLPLSAEKQKKRGYNQAGMIAEGISQVLSVPVWSKVIIRSKATESQTHKNRIERWENIKDAFNFMQNTSTHSKGLNMRGAFQELKSKNVLLVDDVITTGATLEACGSTLLQAKGLTLNIASIAYTL